MSSPFKLGCIALLCALAALGLAACGGDDEGSDPAAEAQRQAQAEAEAKNAEVLEQHERRKQAEAPSEAEQEADRTASRFYEVLGAERRPRDKNRTTIDSSAFCDLMSEEAREQTVEYARRSSGIEQEWNCESAVELLVLRSKRSGGFKGARAAEVIGVNVEGDRATATVRFGKKGPASSLALVREGGEWKLAASPAGGEG